MRNRAFILLGVLGLLTSIAFTGCKKEGSDTNPTPAPSPVPTASPGPLGGVDFDGESFVKPETTPTL